MGYRYKKTYFIDKKHWGFCPKRRLVTTYPGAMMGQWKRGIAVTVGRSACGRPGAAAPKAPLRVRVGELSWSHAKHGSMTEGAGCRNRFAVCTPANPHRLPTTAVIARAAGPWQSVLFPVPLGDRAMLRIAGVTDCHVGLRPPRNDVVVFTWSF